MTKLDIIYVPGIGDHKTYGQDIVIKLWCLLGVRGHYRPMLWREGAFEPKLQALLKEIDGYLAQGHRVGLVGFSAGASAVLNAFAARKNKLAGVVYISGKINAPEAVGETTRINNPAFMESLALLQQNLLQFSAEDKAKLLSIYPYKDRSVSWYDAFIDGMRIRRSPAFSHKTSVIYSLTLGAPGIVQFLRKRS